MADRTIVAQTGISGSDYYPPFFNVSVVDGRVVLSVRAPERKPPHPAPLYPIAGQYVKFVLTAAEVDVLARELTTWVADFTTKA